MADPFEIRMKFTYQLQHLNASTASAQKAAAYALKYKDQDEDLHSCILEQLEKNNNSMNNRANIMYFIEQLCDQAKRDNHPEYVRMIQRDILRIIDAVAPNDASGAANVKVVRHVLHGLQQKSVLSPNSMAELEECLKERDAAPSHPALSPMDIDNETLKKELTSPKTNGLIRQDKKQIEQRIEEDRERHKRLRESIWQVDGEAEFSKLWEDVSDIDEDDFDFADEDAEERHFADQRFNE